MNHAVRQAVLHNHASCEASVWDRLKARDEVLDRAGAPFAYKTANTCWRCRPADHDGVFEAAFIADDP
ncbi:hypothetical protein, partial [Methylobacterium sp. BTF04]|uniref:hypothetical protein n=1 Tax=Methylobacterium sp. BTF04 TaxID=2708300 RepID=UPI001953718B